MTIYNIPRNETVELENIEVIEKGMIQFPSSYQEAVRNYLIDFETGFNKTTYGEKYITHHKVQGDEKTSSILNKAIESKKSVDAIDDRKEYEYSIRIDQMRAFEKAYGLRSEKQKELNSYLSFVEKCNSLHEQLRLNLLGLNSHFKKLIKSKEHNLIANNYEVIASK